MKKEEQTKDAWAVWANTDLTEGRGHNVVKRICIAEATARRLAKGIDVQGSDGYVSLVKLILVDGSWYGPINLERPTKEDEQTQKKIDAAAAAMKKALEAGLTEEDLRALLQGYGNQQGGLK